MKSSLLLLNLGLATTAFAQTCPQNFTPVDLNTYYASAENLSGSSLKTALNLIIKGHTNHGYGCAWDILRIADEDPNNSNNVIGFYTRRSIAKADRDFGQNTPNAWNREHVWARSHGIGSNRGSPAFSDTHHLRATDKSTNADRGSKDFADGGTQHHECSGCTFTSSTWSPPDEVKGDTARMMFYMATRYEGDDGVADLNLVDQSGTGGNQHGDLCDMLQWHVDDVPSTEEQNRNEIIYSFQGNRNPFIDNPDYAVLIWGDTCGITLPPPPPPEPEFENDETVPFIPWWGFLLLGGLFVKLGRQAKSR